MAANIESRSTRKWDKKHQEELEFVEGKLEKKKFEAHKQGVLLEGHYISLVLLSACLAFGVGLILFWFALALSCLARCSCSL